MNYVHFSPHYPQNYYQFSIALKRAGAKVFGIGDQQSDQLRQELRESLTEYYRVDDMHNIAQLRAAVEYFTNKYGQINGIDSHNEYWLETEALLRSQFNIPGLLPEQLSQLRKKSEMKKIYQRAGIRVAAGLVVQTIEETRQFIRKTGYPVIAKPDKGVGAANTYKIHDENDLQKFFAEKPPLEFIMEEFIQGDIFSFDGLAGSNGEPVFFTAMQYEKGVMEVLHHDSHTYYFTFRNIPADLEKAGRKVLKTFGVKNRFFHFEFFREHKSGELVALEVNLRPPGGFTTDMHNYSCDINVYEAWAELVVQNNNKLRFERKNHVCFVSRKSRYDYTLSHDEIMQRFGDRIAFYTGIEGAIAQVMGDSCYLVRSSNLEEVIEIQRAIHQYN